MRIDGELIDALRPHHPLWVMTHFNHPKELTPEARRGAARASPTRGFPVMNQTVLLRGVNDSARTLPSCSAAWCARACARTTCCRRRARGTAHLRTPLQDRHRHLCSSCRAGSQGIALPKLIVDTPGGKGKVPVGPQTIVEQAEGRTTLRTFRGEHVVVLDPPANRDNAARGRSSS